MKIRPATQADIAALAAVAAASYRAGFSEIVSEAALQLRSQAHFEKRFAEQWQSITLLELTHGRIAGFNQVREGKLDMLFVDPAFIGHGHGVALLAEAEARGAKRLDCFRDNHAARRFYERHGWQLQGEFIQDFAGYRIASVSYWKP
jgi:putative acetyltransferase